MPPYPSAYPSHPSHPYPAVCPWCEAEKKSSMVSVKDAGSAKEWEAMNNKNREKMAAWLKSKETKVNLGRQIGVPMIEWVE